MASQRSTSSNPPPPFTPPSYASLADSDDETDASNPTPIHSPGGPQYDDLPPSYDDAQQQAVENERNGIPTLDANQLEAHRLTLNEGPNEPEVWEYRIRGENPDIANDHEQAPAYEQYSNGFVPVHHVSSSENIPIGIVGSERNGLALVSDPTSALLNQALKFASHKLGSDVQHAPRLARCIAIPQEGLPARASEALPDNQFESDASLLFLRVYAKPLHNYDVRPAEFVEFLDGLTAMCEASRVSHHDLVSKSSKTDSSWGIVHDYVERANDIFFAPRGLKTSLRSLSALLTTLNIPIERGQRAGATASVVDEASTGIKRAQSLYPWIEALDTDVPAPNTRTLALREITQNWRDQGHAHAGPSHTVTNSVAEQSRRGPRLNRRGGPRWANARRSRASPLSGPEKLQRNSKADVGEKASHQHNKKEKGKALDDCDDISSISSDTSDTSDSSDSDSDSDEDDDSDPQENFLARIHSINARAEGLMKKGKKTPEEITQDRALAIEKAHDERVETSSRVEERKSQRALEREWRQKRRDLKRQHRTRRREMRNTHEGKGKEKLKKTKHWKEEKKTYREMKKELRKEKKNARKELKNAKGDRRIARGGELVLDSMQEEVTNTMVWVIIESLGP